MKTWKVLKILSLYALSVCSFALIAAPAFAHSCAEELPAIEAQIEKMPDSADKNTAAHQYERAKERHSAGKEKSCLRYLEAARSAIEAWQMHDDD
jgi:hypothetical protein